MGLYVGIDLHSSNSLVGIAGERGERVYQRKLANDLRTIVQALEPYRDQVVGVVVESTYNWYWLVDGLAGAGYRVHLANPSAIQRYSGVKHADDTHDAFWLADMLRLGILPEGYVYPKEDRPLRDLLRKRRHLVALRTSLITSLKNIITRNIGVTVTVNDIKRLTEDRVAPLLEGNGDLALAGQVSKASVDFLTRQVRAIEKVVEEACEIKPGYRHLLTIPGVGKILGLTIMLETGPISRFAQVGNYVSYCRAVSSHWTSNGKSKGRGNKKNGNRYLAWAFSEAAELARRYDQKARAYYNRKAQKSNFMVAHSALAHKLARAAYHVMKEEVSFMPEKLFG